jgi:hypothetical protein
MEKDLGYRKVVYKDGTYTKVVEGSCFSDGNFIRVKKDNDNVYIHKDAVIIIKARGNH